MNHLIEPETCREGRNILIRSPFRSKYFVTGSIFALGSMAASVYLICRHWKALGVYGSVMLGLCIGLQALYQWLRALRCYWKLRELCSETSHGEVSVESCLVSVLKISELGVYNLMLYSGGLALFALIIIGTLLRYIDGLK